LKVVYNAVPSFGLTMIEHSLGGALTFNSIFLFISLSNSELVIAIYKITI